MRWHALCAGGCLPWSRSRSLAAAKSITRVRCWTHEEFGGAEREWQALLAASAADPLFMSWSWQWLWWESHRTLLGGELVLLACYDGPLLVGVAPFFRHRATHRGGITARRLQSIGSTWRDGRGVFSEYLDLIAETGYEQVVVAAVGNWLREDRGWSDLILGNTPVGGLAARLAQEVLAGAGLVRSTDPLEAHRVRLAGTFEDYLRGLPGSVRRKVWNQRSKLDHPRVVIAGAAQAEVTLDLIDAFHRARWNAPQYVGVARDFHRAMAPRLAEVGALRMSTLESGGQPIAVMYNIRVGDTEYNLQSGFDADRTAGFSPGYLHFGYSIEEAFRDVLRWFDFLGGQGRHRQYKQDFLTEARSLRSFQVVRSPPLRALYAIYDRLMGVRPRGGSSS